TYLLTLIFKILWVESKGIYFVIFLLAIQDIMANNTLSFLLVNVEPFILYEMPIFSIQVKLIGMSSEILWSLIMLKNDLLFL
ncbi:hypothetical protein L9F63_008917, partial [Diploptera punctata]